MAEARGPRSCAARGGWPVVAAALAWCVGCGAGGTPATSPEEPPEATTAGGEAASADEGHFFEDCDRREGARDWLTCVVAVSLREALPGRTVVEVAPLAIRIGEDHTVYLDDLLGQIARSTSEEEAVEHIATFLQATVENLEPVAPTPERVRATLKPAGWARAMTARLGGPPVLSRPFGGGVEVVYVLDLPRSMRVLGVRDLEALGLEEEGLDALARRNLSEALSMPPVRLSPEGGQVAAVQVGDSYDAARLLIPSLWAEVARQTDGHLVVAAPVRDLLLLVDGRDAAAVLALRAAAREAFEAGPYEVSPALFRYTPAGFVPLDADGAP